MTHSEQIEQFLIRLVAFEQSEIDLFMAHRHEVSLAAGEYFCNAGEVCQKLAFVHRGAFSFLVITPDGEQYVKDFSLAGKFLTAYTSFITRQPAQISIRAESDSVLSVWSATVYHSMGEQNLHWNQFGRKMAEYLFLRKEQRELSLLLESAEQRYLRLLQDFPQVLQAVPQYLVASYLGIQPETLSRIRRKLTPGGS